METGTSKTVFQINIVSPFGSETLVVTSYLDVDILATAIRQRFDVTNEPKKKPGYHVMETNPKGWNRLMTIDKPGKIPKKIRTK
jgi:hypothetical protein